MFLLKQIIESWEWIKFENPENGAQIEKYWKGNADLRVSKIRKAIKRTGMELDDEYFSIESELKELLPYEEDANYEDEDDTDEEALAGAELKANAKKETVSKKMDQGSLHELGHELAGAASDDELEKLDELREGDLAEERELNLYQPMPWLTDKYPDGPPDRMINFHRPKRRNRWPFELKRARKREREYYEYLSAYENERRSQVEKREAASQKNLANYVLPS